MKNQKLIVTGAGSGIGRALAIQLSEAGHDVFLVGRTESKLVETQQKINGGEVYTIDLSEVGSGKKVVAACIEKMGQVDGVFHVAGDAPMQGIGEFSGDEINRCLWVNLGVGAEMVAAAWDGFKERGNGFVGLFRQWLVLIRFRDLVCMRRRRWA